MFIKRPTEKQCHVSSTISESHNLVIMGEKELNNNDGLSELPDEILLSIMSNSMTMKEAARNSILSHRWRNLWSCFRVLKFEDPTSMEKLGSYCKKHIDRTINDGYYGQKIDEERTKFVKWVSHVTDEHAGPIIDKFKVKFELPEDYQSDINKWIAFAFRKQVKSIMLDFKPTSTLHVKFDRYSLSVVDLSPYKLTSLKSLCLKYLDVSTKMVELLLNSCTCLEKLWIEGSQSLTSIRSSDPGSSLISLKRLVIMHCSNLIDIEISAPKLLSFEYWDNDSYMKLHIRNAGLLSKVTVGWLEDNESIANTFSSLLICHSKLEYLRLRMNLDYDKVNSAWIGDYILADLTNLKHLVLDFHARCDQSILGWISLIEVCPVLEKLTLNFQYFSSIGKDPRPEQIGKRVGKPHICLKTLELVGFDGCLLDIEFATHMFENAIMLEEVIIHVNPHQQVYWLRNAKKRAMNLQNKLPHGVNFIVK